MMMNEMKKSSLYTFKN